MSQFKKISVWVPVIAAGMFVLGFLAGDMVNRHNGPTAAQKKFQTILNLIRNEYVDEVDLDSLIEKTIPSLLTNLDPHSAYIPASDLQEVNDDLEGFSGVGIQFMLDNDTIKVVEVISGGPAEKVGIMAGDRIIKVNDKNVAGAGIDDKDIRAMLRGPKDTKVTVKIKRNNSRKLLTYEITRGDIPMNTVDAAHIVSPGIGYVRVNKFGRTTYDEFFQALEKLRREGAQDYVIDLRGNTGGYMEIALMMANEFLERGQLIVSQKGRDFNSNHTYPADGNGAFRESQVVVLLNEFSASSSEIFAGALQDNDRALVIGRRSFGKGLIQRQSELPDSSAIRLTIGRYYTPSGRCIQKDYSNLTQYEHDILDRYTSGEMFSADSVKINKDLKFHTAHGRTVYGGGGIMPDLFVPVDTTDVTRYFLEVSGRNILFRYTLEYADRHRDALNAVKTIPELQALLDADKELMNDFIRYAARNGVQPDYKDIARSRKLIEAQLRAYIGRNTPLNEAGFYVNIYPIDPVMLRAVEVLKTQNDHD